MAIASVPGSLPDGPAPPNERPASDQVRPAQDRAEEPIDFGDVRFWHGAVGWALPGVDVAQVSPADQLRRFWRSYVTAGFVVLAGESLAVLAYLLATPHGSHRSALIAVASTSVGLAGVGCGLANWVAGRSWRAGFALSWSLVAGVAMAGCAYLDGGVASPLLFLIVVPVMYAALGLGPLSVTACGSGAVAELVIVGLADPSHTLPLVNLTMLAAVVLGVAALAVASAADRARLEAHEQTLIGVLRRRAEVDGLTGCANHQAFHERLREEVDRAMRYGRPLSVLVCDVDLFKAFNDTYGHPAGDVALAAVGAGLRSVARSTDLVARVGGDEFAVLMPETGVAQATELAQRIILDRASARPPTVSLSIGVAQLDPFEPNAVRLFRDADAALYEAKQTCRNTVVTATAGPGRLLGADPDAAIDSRSTQSDSGSADRKRMSAAVREARRESDEIATILDTLVEDAPVGFAFVDRSLRLVRANSALAAIYGGTAKEQLGRTVAQVYPDLWPTLEPIYRRVLDNEEPVLNLEVRGRGGHDPSQTRDWLANHYPVRLGADVIGVGVVVVDITDRKRLERAGTELTDAVVSALSATSEARDPYTAGHQRRVSEIAVAIATELGCDTHTVKGIGLAAAIHDIGKVAIPAEILSRPGKLSDAEMALVRTHSAAGFTILRGIEFPWPVAQMVLQHHERLDGSGYPNQLHGEQITIGARIIAVADVVEAMAAHRPYRPSLGLDRALSTVADGRGTLFEPDIVDACLHLFRHGPRTAELTRLLRGDQTRLDSEPTAPVAPRSSLLDD